MAVNVQFAFRNDTAANWTANNPTLIQGELGLESDTNKLKMGNGSSLWTALPYLAAGPTGATGPTGTLGNLGQATLNFGAAPGTSYTSTVVTGQVAILSTSYIQAWVQGDTTATHSADEHFLADIDAVGGYIVPGVGFTLSAMSGMRLTGTFTIRWMWQ